jgi:hypothetical protein
MIRRLLALLVAAGLGFTLLQLPSLRITSGDGLVGHDVNVRATDLSLTCPGPIFLNKTNKVGSFTRAGNAAVQLAAGASSNVLQNTIALLGQSQKPLTSLSATISDAASAVAADSSGQLPQGSAMLTASQMQKVTTDQASGLAGAACQRASGDIWLVGGDTTTGRETLLLVSNPTAVDSTVDLEIFSTAGRISAPGLSGLSVAAGRTVVVPVNGLSPNTDCFVIHVQASGGAVAAWLQQRVVRGLFAAGLDIISPSNQLAKKLSIPGLLIRGTDVLTNLQSKSSNYSDVSNAVRVFNPSHKAAHVLVQVNGVNQQTFGTVVQATVAPGTVADLQIDSLKTGDYNVTVTSDVAVRAAAKLNRGDKTAKPVTDFAWLPSVAPVSGTFAVAVGKDGISKLSIMNPTAQAVEVKVTSAGQTASLQLAAGASKVLRVGSGRVVLQSSQAISATVLTDINSSIAAIALVDYRNIGGKLTVRVH